mmetsp:Transcript_16564/g.24915  ORF Transcript_16564/g.24915 Transcript_16564/m.24915 type:complete len:562 (-) Transcript_16564:144-1829(-)
MCGILGIVLTDENSYVNQALVDGLTVLQHRGQDAAGIVTLNRGRLHLLKNSGTVNEIFTQSTVVQVLGNIGIGHVRYPTAGGGCLSEAQPLYTNSPFGIACAHNGNLTNTEELMISMQEDMRHINTSSDTELLMNVFAEELQRKRLRKMSPDEVFDAVRSVMRRCKGAYAVTLLINGVGLLAFRDPHGIRPLCYGARKQTNGPPTGYAVASESVAIDALAPSGFSLCRDVMPGEAVLVTLEGKLFSQQCHSSPSLSPCIFEFVYFARPDSVLDGVSVYEARLNMGEKLAKKILRDFPDHDIDVVMPIPDTSRVSALQCAVHLNRQYREGFVKNRYIARTFIMPGQEMRRKTVRLKLNTVRSEFKGKCVLMVDDSIVRGTTCTEIIQMARDAGARKIFFASAAPPVRYPNVYGIDIPSREELIAHSKTEAEIANAVGADEVVYNDLEDLEDSIRTLNPALQYFDTSCFSGHYVTPEVTEEMLAHVEAGRGRGRMGHPGLVSPRVVHDGANGSMEWADSIPHAGSEVPFASKNGDSLSSPCEGLHNIISDMDTPHSSKKARTC